MAKFKIGERVKTAEGKEVVISYMADLEGEYLYGVKTGGKLENWFESGLTKVEEEVNYEFEIGDRVRHAHGIGVVVRRWTRNFLPHYDLHTDGHVFGADEEFLSKLEEPKFKEGDFVKYYYSKYSVVFFDSITNSYTLKASNVCGSIISGVEKEELEFWVEEEKKPKFKVGQRVKYTNAPFYGECVILKLVPKFFGSYKYEVSVQTCFKEGQRIKTLLNEYIIIEEMLEEIKEEPKPEFKKGDKVWVKGVVNSEEDEDGDIEIGLETAGATYCCPTSELKHREEGE